MTNPTKMCPSCYFQNHISAQFCTICGKTLNDAGDAQAEDQLVPNERPESPKSVTESLLHTVVKASGYKSRQTRAGYAVTVPLGKKRQQKVHVIFNGYDDDGNDVISFISIASQAKDSAAMSMLRLNNKMHYGSFAVKTINGKEYFVVMASQLAETADLKEISKQLFEVARRADMVENLLSKGKDAF